MVVNKRLFTCGRVGDVHSLISSIESSVSTYFVYKSKNGRLEISTYPVMKQSRGVEILGIADTKENAFRIAAHILCQ